MKTQDTCQWRPTLTPLPCPFCGATPTIEREALDERFAYANVVTIRCACGCSISAHGDASKPGYADNSTTEQRAIERWNRRNP